jgi:hypothetical protein
MRERIIKALKISGIFMGGIIVGAVLMNLLHMYVRPAYREMIRTELKSEQEALAQRTNRQNDKLRSVSHRWNVVDSESESGFRAFRKERNRAIDSSFLFPFYMLVLDAMVHPKKGMQEKGARIVEGIDRGHLALALECIGAHKEADRQWEIAQTLTKKKSIDDIRQFILKLQEQENTDTYLQAERAILGDDTDNAQQRN